ncbi:MAG: ATP synthase F1 subunit gamma [Candidatus Aminicenantes bacterium]|nr:ATP synthase F1 subunit gamma [Candidatus Aminicenantes bacterium]NIM77873.1 ATP synthase F1 subunit gamma [Candidatus Aminicenantes bacterium]NIN17186.1 ATP synthase F1 subunit gamma [Candidatus Aminicenantes bacterium]NIN41079.1 ATP synthase F1 subunit gamma [Candidatus Aminicenantes bacterium]NIN83884.1 ATP synthase F1 subunit gamma [Candidatus Aminicenantes bacterium]
MAQNLIDLRRRIKAVMNTQKTTQAMKTVSAAKMRRSVMELKRSRPIMEKIASLLKQVSQASHPGIKSHPLLKERKSGHNFIVVVSSDKGLCGAFNSHVIETAEERYHNRLNREGDNISFITVGNKAFKHFKKRKYPIAKDYHSIMGRLKYESALDLSEYLRDIFLNPEEGIKSIEFVFTAYISASKYEVTVSQLFPIKMEWEGSGESEGETEDIEYIFEPSAEEIFRALLPKYINSKVFQTLLQSAASEHAARMIAMDLATRNASDMIRDLTLTMNKLRQASITKELLEIMTATEALTTK